MKKRENRRWRETHRLTVLLKQFRCLVGCIVILGRTFQKCYVSFAFKENTFSGSFSHHHTTHTTSKEECSKRSRFKSCIQCGCCIYGGYKEDIMHYIITITYNSVRRETAGEQLIFSLRASSRFSYEEFIRLQARRGRRTTMLILSSRIKRTRHHRHKRCNSEIVMIISGTTETELNSVHLIYIFFRSE